MSDGAISNVRTTRITKIWTYIIQITSYHDTTVSITVVFAILTFEIVARNCQTLAHIRLVLSLFWFFHIKFVFKKWQMSSWDGSILLNHKIILSICAFESLTVFKTKFQVQEGLELYKFIIRTRRSKAGPSCQWLV